MASHNTDLESMSCAELLSELARLTSEQDALQAQVGGEEHAPETQVAAIDRQHGRMARISELLTAKNCASAQG